MRRFLTIILVLMLSLATAACGGGSTPASEAAPESQASSESAATAGAPESEETTQPAGNDAYADLDPIELSFGNGAAIGAAGDLWALSFNEKVEAITGGKIKVNYFPNSQLGVDSELQQQLLAGDIHIVAAQTAQTTSFVPEVAVFDLPLVFAKYDATTIDKALNDSPFTSMINEGYAAANMINIGFLQGATFREMTSNKKIETVDDFSGVKIRTMDAKYHLAFWSALGANPTPLAFTELYMSLQQGVVDAQENATDTCVNSKFNEVQDYLVETHHILYMNQFLMNKNYFDSLPQAYQDAIRQAVAEATAGLAPQMKQIDEDNKAALLEGGMELCTFDEVFYDAVVEKAQPVYDQIRTEISAELVDSLIQELQNAAG